MIDPGDRLPMFLSVKRLGVDMLIEGELFTYRTEVLFLFVYGLDRV